MSRNEGPAPRMSRVYFRGVEENRIVADRHDPPAVAPRGGRPPVILVHGGGQTRHAWKRTAEHLAGLGFTAYAVDQRGHGDSQWVDSGRYTYADYADDLALLVAEIARTAGLAPVVVGASLGGIAGMVVEGASPGTLSALVLVDIVPQMDPRGVDRIVSFMRAHLDSGFANLDEAAAAVAAYQPHRKRPLSREGLLKNLRLDRDGRYRWHWDPRFLDGPAPAGSGAIASEADLVALAARMAAPVLLVRGALSDLCTPDSAAAFLETVPHAEAVDVAAAAHMVAGDRNDVVLDAIADFLERVPLPARATG